MASSKRQTEENISFMYADGDMGVPTIEEEDLADVRSEIDLHSLGGLAHVAADIELQSIGVPDNVTARHRSYSPNPSPFASRNTSTHSHLDDEIGKDDIYDSNMKGHDAAASSRKSIFWLLVFVATTTCVALAVIIPASRKISDRDIDKKLRDEGSAYGFDETAEFGPLKDVSGESFGEDENTIAIINAKLDLEAPFPAVIRNNFVDVAKWPFEPEKETPFFWQIPNAGSTMQSIMSACDHLVLASNDGKAEDINPLSLERISVHKHDYVNVNLANPTGITHAAELGLVPSRLADVVATHHLHHAGKMLFGPNHQARAFTILRHPIERALSSYRALKLHSTNEKVRNMTLTEYIDSQFVESNWLTRFLTNHRQGELGTDQIDVAKEILRQKFLIGLYDQFEESVFRIETYFGWTITSPPGAVSAAKTCRGRMLERARERDKDDVVFLETKVKHNDPNYMKLKALNEFDLEIYWYAVELFKEQQELMADIVVVPTP